MPLPYRHKFTHQEFLFLVRDEETLRLLLKHQEDNSSRSGYPECFEDASYHRERAQHYRERLSKDPYWHPLSSNDEAYFDDDEVRVILNDVAALMRLEDFMRDEAWGALELHEKSEAEVFTARANMYGDEAERLRRIEEAENEG